jgi:hypothetical protein
MHFMDLVGVASQFWLPELLDNKFTWQGSELPDITPPPCVQLCGGEKCKGQVIFEVQYKKSGWLEKNPFYNFECIVSSSF